MYDAFKILGYRPFHMAEVAMRPDHDATFMKIFEQALESENNILSGIPRYSRADLDKWLADYDVFIEVGSYFPQTTLHAYLDDPDVRFLLTERDPDRWAASFDAFVGGICLATTSLPLNVLRYFDPVLWHLYQFNHLAYWLFSDKTSPAAPEVRRRRVLRRNYVNYIRTIKRSIPSDRLTVIKLEDGLGWKQLCAFTGDAVPSQSYPTGTEHNKIKEKYFQELILRASVKMVATVVPVIGIGVWAFLNRSSLAW